MSYNACVMSDSYSRDNNSRLTTLEITFPRFILAELNTHRVFSRNSSSSRAIPTWRLLEEVRDNPFIPEVFGAYQSGMVSGEPLSDEKSRIARSHWLSARNDAVRHAMSLVYGSDVFFDSFMEGASLSEYDTVGAHKEIVNRLLEPFMWQTAIVSSTQWDNFFTLRCASNAQPQIRIIAEMMRTALNESTPIDKEQGHWHIPFVTREECEDMETTDILMLSAGRCARISYLNHHRDRDASRDISLARRLLKDGHMSPFEHQALPLQPHEQQKGNLIGWTQQRHIVSL